MAEEKNSTILLDVGMEGLIDSLRDLKKQYDANTQAMKDLKAAGEEDSAEYVKLANENRVLKGEMAGVEKQIQNQIKQEKAQADSLVALRAKLANLNKQYDSMSGMRRMSAEGKNLQNQIKGLSDQIMGLEAGTGRFQRNVGNYSSALQGLSASFTQAGISAGGLNKAIQLLKLSNPIVIAVTAALAGLVAVAKKVRDAFKANEETTNDLKEAMSALNPVTDKVNKMFDGFATGLNKVVGVTIDKVTYTIYQLLDALQQLGNWFGADWKMGDNFAAASVAARKLQKDENEYIKHKREWVTRSAKIDNEIAKLREMASDKERYTAEQRLSFLDKAIKKEEYKAEIEMKLAKENLDLLEREAARGANDAEANDKLAEAKAAVYRAETNLFNVRKSLGKQRNAAAKEIAQEIVANKKLTASEKMRLAEEKGVADEVANLLKNKVVPAVKQLREQLELIEMMTKDEIIDAKIKKNKELADSIKEVADKVGLLKTETQELAQTSIEMPEIGDGSEQKGPSWIEQLAADFQNNAEIIEGTVSGITNSFGSLSSIYDTISKDETRSSEEREAAAEKSKTWAKMQIAANAGVAVAKGTAAAMDMSFPANLPALASVLAAVLSAIAQAKALAGDATVTSSGTMSIASTGNADAPVKPTQQQLTNAVNNGGSNGAPVTPKQQQQLTNAVNNWGSNSTATLAAMLNNMPAPTLVYSEFSKFTKSVKYATDKAKLQ